MRASLSEKQCRASALLAMLVSNFIHGFIQFVVGVIGHLQLIFAVRP
jgi:hypothetical protein